MKKILPLLICLLPIAAMSQMPQPFHVKGKIGNDNASVFLYYQVGSNKVLDSTKSQGGSFEFNGDLIYPSLAVLIVDHKNQGSRNLDFASSDRFVFYLDKVVIEVRSADSAVHAKVLGSAINDQYVKLVAINEEAAKKIRALTTEALKSSDKKSPNALSDMQARIRGIQEDMHKQLKNFVLSNPDSYLSLMTISSLGSPTPDPNELLPLLDGLSQRLKDTEVARALRNQLETLKSTSIGALAPDFEQTDTLGHPVRLSSFRGKYVLLDFWASWCGPCREESPTLVKAYQDYQAKGFTILSVSLDKPSGAFAWLNAIRQDHLGSWTHVSDLKFWNNAVAQLYFVQSIPKNFLIDPNGKIIAQDLRGEDLEAKLAEVIRR